ncbi:MAG: sugar phosphate isomerase/epimerase [Oscillospiraceae bacterium]|nr:sugar phosphate isomerase/epimerase [Oscillospiraceae bacterium]
MIIGAQLFSVRDRCKDEEGIRNTFKEMKEIGYNSVQLSGFKYDPDKICEYKSEFDMHVGLTHTNIPTLLNDVDSLIENHKKMGVEVIGLGSPGVYLSEDRRDLRIDDMLRDFETPVKKINDAGLRFAYHNHFWEFYDKGGYCYMDVLFEKTNWNFTLDTGWVHFAGADPFKTIEKFKDRLEYVHLKDYRAEKEENEDCMKRLVPMYAGVTPMDDIIRALVEVSTVKVAYVEQDSAAGSDNSYGEMKKSFDAIKAHGWVK